MPKSRVERVGIRRLLLTIIVASSTSWSVADDSSIQTNSTPSASDVAPSASQDSQTANVGAQGSYSTALLALADKYNLDQPLAAPNVDSPTIQSLSQREFLKKIGAFLDNEQQTSGTYFTLDDSASPYYRGPDALGEGTNLENGGDFVKQGIIHVKVTFVGMQSNLQPDPNAIRSVNYNINVRDIPFLLYCENKCKEWTKTAIANNLSEGVRKDIGTSDSGKLKATYITVDTYAASHLHWDYGKLELTVDSNLYCDLKGSEYGIDLINVINYILYTRIDKARADYQANQQAAAQKNSDEQKKQQDQSNINNILK